ncbi:MAG: prenyltransferase/squalene oxidase repeat-containing protein [Planctomycetota bacterium]|jgi:hypothetical protein
MRHLAAAAAVLLAARGALSAPDTAGDAAELTPRAKISIDRGLEHLASTQREDGSWPGNYGNTTGVVASCSLAFMAAGHTPGVGKYGANTAKCIRFLLGKARPDGLLYQDGMHGGPMYHHGLATLALAEAWGMTQDRRVQRALKRAVQRILASQNMRGGWRYQPRMHDDDLSVTVMQLMALRAARDAGIFVPKDAIDAGIEYVKLCHNSTDEGRDGGFAYTPRGGSGFARTGAGVLSLQVAGDYRAKEVKDGVAYILRFKPVGNEPVDQWYFYGHYYAAQGVYQSQSVGPWGRKAWHDWYPAVTKEFTTRQDTSGGWKGSHDQYPTSMALLVLEIPYRYLPIYQR